jgi:uncharacterized DUF497 family protein
MPLLFVWNPRKADLNLKKHRLSFAEAASAVFSDPLARIFADDSHSVAEPREIIIGHSSSGKLALLCFIEVEQETVRIISARFATRKEQRDYEEHATS